MLRAPSVQERTLCATSQRSR